MLTDMRLFVQSILGPPVKQGHKWWVWHCQVNKPDKNPSLKVESQGFKCFSCGAGGYPYHFLVKEMGYRPEAARLEVGGKPKKYRSRPDVQYDVGPSPPSLEWRQTLSKILQNSQVLLPQAERYLAWGRCIKMETAAHFGLGYCPQWFPITVGDLRTWLAPGVVIPAFVGGTLWSVEVRVLGKESLKYHRPKGVSEPVPFGLAHLQGKDTLVVVEGSLDALSVWQVAGDDVDVLALRGAHNSLRFWMGYLAGYRRVIVATDANQAGDRIAQDLKALHPTWERRWPVGGASDLNDMLRAGTLLKGWLIGEDH